MIDDNNQSASELLSVPGMYEVLSEYYNNEVLDRFRDEQDKTGE